MAIAQFRPNLDRPDIALNLVKTYTDYSFTNSQGKVENVPGGFTVLAYESADGRYGILMMADVAR